MSDHNKACFATYTLLPLHQLLSCMHSCLELKYISIEKEEIPFQDNYFYIDNARRQLRPDN